MQIAHIETAFSINDLGCGYGALYDYMSPRYDSFTYSGIDVSENMVLAAEKRLKSSINSSFTASNKPDQIADYSVASGIFNVRMGRSDNEWKAYMETTLSILNRASKIGFAFNCLTSYSDADKMRDYLYYANAGDLFNLCKNRYSHNVALLHDYDLYEFTILVRKKT